MQPKCDDCHNYIGFCKCKTTGQASRQAEVCAQQAGMCDQQDPRDSMLESLRETITQLQDQRRDLQQMVTQLHKEIHGAHQMMADAQRAARVDKNFAIQIARRLPTTR